MAVLLTLFITYILLGDLMKKIIKGTFLLLLVGFSFFYTEKVIDMINKEDPLMIEIINVKSNYEILPVNATIDNDTVIPGIIGREINIQKSYDNMRINGVFREDALVFNDLIPNNSVENNRDKYIIKGSGSKKEVAILTIFNSNYVDKINCIDNITIFINHKDLTISNINKLENKEIYTYGDNGLYNNEIIASDSALIDRLSNNNSKYCLVKNKDNNTIEICNKNGMYTVFPNIIGGYFEIKNNLSNGSIILLDNLNNIDNVIRYVMGKGYEIVTLSNLLSEQ